MTTHLGALLFRGHRFGIIVGIMGEMDMDEAVLLLQVAGIQEHTLNQEHTEKARTEVEEGNTEGLCIVLQ